MDNCIDLYDFVTNALDQVMKATNSINKKYNQTCIDSISDFKMDIKCAIDRNGDVTIFTKDEEKARNIHTITVHFDSISTTDESEE